MIGAIVKSLATSKQNNMTQAVSVPQPAVATTFTPSSKFGKWWYTLSPTERKVYMAIGVGVGLFASYKTYKYFSDRAQEKDEKEASDSAKNDYDKLLKQGKILSKPQSSYISVANSTEKFLDGCDSSSSEYEVIKNIIRVVKKPIDWAYLKSTFGVRKISDCGSFGASKTEYDLATLLNDQLDTFMAYDLDVDGYKDKGVAQESIDILKKYFSKIGVTI
jgi:hypothetical protein